MNDKVKVKIEPTGNDSIIATSSPKETSSSQHKLKSAGKPISEHLRTPQDHNVPIGISTPKPQKVCEKKTRDGRNYISSASGSATGSGANTTAATTGSSTNSSAKLSAFFVNLPDESATTSNSISNVFMTSSKSKRPLQKVQFKGEPIDDDGYGENIKIDTHRLDKESPDSLNYTPHSTPCNTTKRSRSKSKSSHDSKGTNANEVLTATKTASAHASKKPRKNRGSPPPALDDSFHTRQQQAKSRKSGKQQDNSQLNLGGPSLSFSKPSVASTGLSFDVNQALSPQAPAQPQAQAKKFNVPGKCKVNKSDVYVKDGTETEEDYLNLLDLGSNNPFELSVQEQVFLNYAKLDMDKWIEESSNFNKEYQKLFEEVIKIRLKFNKRFLMLVENLDNFVLDLEKHGDELNKKSGLIKEYCEKIVNGVI